MKSSSLSEDVGEVLGDVATMSSMLKFGRIVGESCGGALGRAGEKEDFADANESAKGGEGDAKRAALHVEGGDVVLGLDALTGVVPGVAVASSVLERGLDVPWGAGCEHRSCSSTSAKLGLGGDATALSKSTGEE